MILITTGSYGFEKLIEAIDVLVGEGLIKKDLLAQISGSKYIPKHMEYFKSSPDILKFMEDSEFVISHGGAGTITELLLLNKKIIAVANRDLADDHQYPLLKKLSDKNSLLFCPEPSPELLLDAITKVDSFIPQKCSFFSDKLIKELQRDLTSKVK